jgi:glycosyltransferase involved in cell wall biosynthesis
MPDVVDHGVDGYLVEPRDVATAGRYAMEILARADRGRGMGRRAREDARRRFCAEDVIPRYEAYYRRVLEAAVSVGA